MSDMSYESPMTSTLVVIILCICEYPVSLMIQVSVGSVFRLHTWSAMIFMRSNQPYSVLAN